MSARKVAQGRKLAVRMLREIEAGCKGQDGITDASRYCLWGGDADGSEYVPYRDGPQDNIVLRYIGAIGNDPAALTGFGEILSDFISCNFEGGVRNIDAYSPAWERRHARRVAVWRKRHPRKPRGGVVRDIQVARHDGDPDGAGA